jgi:hypothetical protein
MNKVRYLVLSYFATLSICIMGGLWISNGYVGVHFSNYEGGFERLKDVECFSSTEPGCRSKLPKNVTYNLLLGDSEAISISDLFKAELGDYSYVRALTACSFIPESIVRESMNEDCRILNSNSLKIVSKKTCKNVFIFNRFRPESNSEEVLYFDFISKIAKSCQSLTVIGAPTELNPRFNAYSNMVMKTAMNSPRVFNKVDFDPESLRWNKTLANFIGKQNFYEVNYINTHKLVVTSYPTSLRNSDGEYTYTDSTHLSKYGGAIIMAEISRLQRNS